MAQPRFGDLLRHYRQVAGFSQQHLAEKARMSVNAVSLLERGVRRAPHSTTLRQLTEALDLSADEASELEAAALRARARGQGEHPVAGVPGGNLPYAVTSFVGRDGEIAELRTMVLDEARRLVTVVGPGGVGKSRLVLEMAHQMNGAFDDGVWLIALANLSDPSEVGAAIAKALRIETGRSDAPLAALTRALRDRETLLILDNCEHLIDGVAEVVSAVVSSAPGVRIVATSRERLRIQGETTFPLSPLALPPSRVISPDEARSYPSVDLFVHRAAAVSPDFAKLRTEDVATVADIVCRLDGLPLAIELAVPMLRFFGIGGLSIRLRDRLPLPAPGDRDLPQHHRTIEGIVDWSYQRLSDVEQFVFAAASAFAGSFTGEALVDVCGQAGVDAESAEPALAALIDKSLIAVVDRSRTRYVLLETIRDYAGSAALRSGRQAELRRFHARYYLRVAEGLQVVRSGSERAKNVARMMAPNFRAALAWALIDGSDAVIGARLAVALSEYLEEDSYSTARQWFDRAAAAVDPLAAPQLWADVVIGGEFFSQYSVDRRERLLKLEKAVAITREHGNPRRLAEALLWLASLCYHTGQSAQAEAAADEAALLARGEDARFLARALQFNAVMLAGSNLTKRRALLVESIRVYQPEEPDIGVALRLGFLSDLEFQCGNLDAALALAREAAEYLERVPLSELPARVAIFIGLASTALIAGDRELGAGAARTSIEIAAEVGDPLLVALALQPHAYARALNGNLEVAAMLMGYSEKRTSPINMGKYPPAWQACGNHLRTLLASDPRGGDLKKAEERGAQWSDDHALEVALS
jgi:predicted ATPase/DNA-binding XRE family transcriptional regulator